MRRCELPVQTLKHGVVTVIPRLYVRTLTGKFAVFYAASPEMVAEFERMVSELKAFRSMR